MNKLLLLEFQSFPFAIHDSFQLFEMPQFDFEFFHLSFNQQSNKGFDFPFLNCSQVFGFYSRRGESWKKKSNINMEHISIWKIKINEGKNEPVIYINLVLKSQFVREGVTSQLSLPYMCKKISQFFQPARREEIRSQFWERNCQVNNPSQQLFII